MSIKKQFCQLHSMPPITQWVGHPWTSLYLRWIKCNVIKWQYILHSLTEALLWQINLLRLCEEEIEMYAVEILNEYASIDIARLQLFFFHIFASHRRFIQKIRIFGYSSRKHLYVKHSLTLHPPPSKNREICVSLSYFYFLNCDTHCTTRKLGID